MEHYWFVGIWCILQYIGQGRGQSTPITDYNDCTTGTHNCHAQATCQKVVGGFTCTCKSGYTGNGDSCTASTNTTDVFSHTLANASKASANATHVADHSTSATYVTSNLNWATASLTQQLAKINFTNPVSVLSYTTLRISTRNNSIYASQAGGDAGKMVSTLNSKTSITAKTVGADITKGATISVSASAIILPSQTSINAWSGSTEDVRQTGNVVSTTNLGNAASQVTKKPSSASSRANMVSLQSGAIAISTTASYKSTKNAEQQSSISPDNNTCISGTHNCHWKANCTNTDGSFICSCKAGYTGNGVNCVDDDECTSGTHNCHLHARCQNTDGSFNCSCKAGYTGNGVNCVFSVSVSKDVFCFSNRFGISVARSLTSRDDVSVTLKDTSCVAASNATHYLLSTAFRECGSISNETKDHVVVSNAVIIFDASNGVITRGNKITIPFSCMYKRSDLDSSLASFQPTINSSIHAREDGFGNFTLNINMARSVRFDSYYDSYPVNAKVNDRLFIQVSLNANNSDFVLIIEECYTTSSWNKNDATKYTMIEKMCPTDSTLQFHSGEIHHKKFSFLAFNFLNNVKTIYLHCGVYLCHKSSKSARCTSGCDLNQVPASRKKRDVQKREIGDPDYTSTYVLDTGAIQKAEQNKGNKGTSLSSVSTTTITLGVAVGIFCLLSVSIVIVKMIKRRRTNCIKREQSHTFGKQGIDNKAVEMEKCT